MSRARLAKDWERDAQSYEDYEAEQQEKRARLLRGSAAPASVSATGARGSTDVPPRPSCLGGREYGCVGQVSVSASVGLPAVANELEGF